MGERSSAATSNSSCSTVLTPGAIVWMGWVASQGSARRAGAIPTDIGFMTVMPTSCRCAAGMTCSSASRRTMFSGSMQTSTSPVSMPFASAVRSLWPARPKARTFPCSFAFNTPSTEPPGAKCPASISWVYVRR